MDTKHNIISGRAALRLLPAAAILAVLGMAALASWAFSQTPPAQSPPPAKVLRVGGDHNYPPYHFVENGRPAGFDVDMIRAIAREAGYAVEFYPGPWSEVRQALDEGRIDVIAGMAYSPDRDLNVDFTTRFTDLQFDVFVLENSEIATLDDAISARIGVQEGGLMHEFLTTRGAADILLVPDAPQLIQMLTDGSADAVVMNKYQGLYLIRAMSAPNIRSLGLEELSYPYCFAVADGNQALKVELNMAIQSLMDSGEHQAIRYKWFGEFEANKPFWVTAKNFSIALSVILFILIAVLFWSWTLRRQVAVKTGELRQLLAQHEKAERALLDSEEKFRTLFEKSAMGIARIVYGDGSMEVNEALERMLGYTQKELRRMREETFTHPEDWEKEQKLIERTLSGQLDSYQIEKRFIRKDGRILWTNLTCSMVRNPHTAKPLYAIAMVEDITERRRAEERLRFDSLHDALTGLPNRTLFLDRLNQSIARRKRGKDIIFSVLFMDLDEFKKINDSLGHQVGDELLLEISGRIRDCLRPDDTVARFGGDEFAILLESIETSADAIQVTDRLLQVFSRPFHLSVYEVHVTASIGVVHCPDDPPDAQEILRDADTAMYQAKRRGKNRHVEFDRSMHEAVVFRLTLEEELRRALRQGEMVIHYQPIMEIETGRLAAFEALARWDHPSKGVLHPDLFIALAEETGLIVSLGEQVMRQACRQLQEWRRQFDSTLGMHVNVSVRQFLDPDLDRKIEKALELSGLAPGGLTLEITESVMLEFGPATRQMLSRLQQLGVRLSIDDFGTGYSSLSYLSRLPIESLKIDRLFVTHMTDSEENLEIVRAVGALASAFGLDLVAEGVETTEQLDQLRGMNYHFAQGFYYSYPLEVSEVAQLLAGKK